MVSVNAVPFAARFDIEKQIKSLGVRNGDIFFRETDTKGPFGIPFSALVSKLSNSNFSHGAVARVEGDEVYLLEVNDRGVVKERLLDWLDYCVKEAVVIYRLTDAPEGFDAMVASEIDKAFAADFEYNFNYTYKDPNHYYCTQAVADIYLRCGITLMEPMYMKDVMTKVQYAIFQPINWITLKTSGKGFSSKDKYYFVGNKSVGMMASPLISPVFQHAGLMTLK